MSTLYQQDDWSQHNLDAAIEAINEQMIKGLSASFSIDNMKSYRQEMQKKTQEGHLVSLVDFWGMALEHLIFGKVKIWKPLKCFSLFLCLFVCFS